MVNSHADERAGQGESLLQRVRELAPLIQEHAAGREAECRPADAVIDALTMAGAFRMTTPARYGGYELTLRELFAVLSAISRHCPSTSWISSISMEAGFLLGLMDDRAQDDVWGANPDSRLTTMIAPTGGARPAADGGVSVTGRWAFNSGSAHAHWALLACILVPTEGAPYPVLALMPYSELEIIHDWDTTGLRGSASNSLSATDVQVPAHRMLAFGEVLQGKTLSQANVGSRLFASHPAAFLFSGGIGVLSGLAWGALDQFMTRLPGRTITYSTYASQAEAAITHLRVAATRIRAEEAELLALRAADVVDAAAADGRTLSLDERAWVRGVAGRVTELCKESVDQLDEVSGASSIQRTVPIQRYARDMNALYKHALLHPPTNQELYGRVLLGLEPNSFFL
jgi:alkylation response protein AidB-like acyl-CoA dehydrogenase